MVCYYCRSCGGAEFELDPDDFVAADSGEEGRVDQISSLILARKGGLPSELLFIDTMTGFLLIMMT